MTAATVTPAEKDAARKAAKAAAERNRKAAIKTAKEQLEKAGLDPETKITPEQRDRAVKSKIIKAGLVGKALAEFVLDGKDSSTVVKEAKQQRAAEDRAERSRANVTRAKDPEATELAQSAKALAPDVKSAFLPKDAREFIDVFGQTSKGAKITVTRKDAEPVVFERVPLKAFAVEGEKDADVRKQLATLGKGTRLWGRKLALMILATDAK